MSDVAHPPSDHQFPGFRSPNYTMVPDELFDELLADLSGAELKVLLYVIRRTFGFKKGSDRISKAQLEKGIQRADGTILDRGTGLSRRAIRLAIDSLVERNILLKYSYESQQRGYEPTEYALNVVTSSATPWVPSTQAFGKKVPNPLGTAVPPQETVVQETERQTFRNSKGTRPEIDEKDTAPEEQGGAEYRVFGATELAEATREVRTRRPEREPSEPTAIGDVLKRRHTDKPPTAETAAQPRRRSGRIKPTPRISVFIDDASTRFHDYEHLKSNLTRAMHLLEQSGLEEEVFVHQVLYPAYNETKGRGNITKDAEGTYGLKNRMPYFFRVVEDILDELAGRGSSQTAPDATS